MKLILGTANWSRRPYGLLKEPLSLNLISQITDFARKNGITTLESAEAYGCDESLGHTSFDLIYKVTHPYNLNRIKEKLGRREFMGLLYHHGQDTRGVSMKQHLEVHYVGSSVYTRGQVDPNDQMVEVPLNLENREFENFVAPCKIVRGVFGRGELLKKYSIKECLDFIKGNKTVHGVVVGVDNIKQLEEILEAWK